jgi:hypothetical protein
MVKTTPTKVLIAVTFLLAASLAQVSDTFKGIDSKPHEE